MLDYYMYFIYNGNGEWGLHMGFNPNRLPYPLKRIPNEKDFEYWEGEVLKLNVKGIEKECVVSNILAAYFFTLDKWELYYDLKWKGTGHTRGFFTKEQIEKEEINV